MSKLESDFNSGKMRTWRWPIIIAIMVLIGFIAVKSAVAGGVIAAVVIVGALVIKWVTTKKL